MKYDIYIDGVVIFIWIWNVYLLWAVWKLLSCTATRKRIVLAALAGALITGGSIMLPVGYLYLRLLVGSVTAGFLMLRIGFVYVPIRNYLKVAGVCAVCGFFEGSVFLRLGSIREGKVKWLVTLLIPALLCAAGALRVKLQAKKKDTLMHVQLVCGEKRLTVNAMLDTGNQLWDPLYKQPVNLISRRLAEQLDGMWCENSFHVVPYRSVGRRKGLMDAYRIPEIVVQTEIEDRHLRLPVIAVADQGIDENFAYQMILHPLMLWKEDNTCYSMWQR